jgi:hypothetical protein
VLFTHYNLEILVEPCGQTVDDVISSGTLAKELLSVQTIHIQLIVYLFDSDLYARQGFFRDRLFALKFDYGLFKIRFSNSYCLE